MPNHPRSGTPDGHLELESGADDDAAVVDVVDETVVLIIDREVAIADGRGEEVVELIAEASGQGSRRHRDHDRAYPRALCPQARSPRRRCRLPACVSWVVRLSVPGLADSPRWTAIFVIG